MNTIWEFVEKIKVIYLPAYFKWLTKELSDTEPFMILTMAVMVLFALVVYVWFRNRN